MNGRPGARPLWWFERPGVAAAEMPQRPSWYQRYSKYCCATVRNPLLTCTVRVADTFSRSAFAVSCMYGSTALLEKIRLPPGSNGTSAPGLMQPTSSAICFDSPSTTDVEHPEDV